MVRPENPAPTIAIRECLGLPSAAAIPDIQHQAGARQTPGPIGLATGPGGSLPDVFDQPTGEIRSLC